MKIATGQPAPDITLPDHAGAQWSLGGQRGTPVVLYFYPKDDTPGCTTQACDIRDHWAEFSELGVPVVGISPDDVDSHAEFVGRYDLPHTLLADTDRAAIDAYGAWGEKTMHGKTYEGVMRSSVVVDGDGQVAAVFDQITPNDQSAKALEAVRKLLG
ncbi:MAG: thioredoxin-dependent thiol peroxidase [Euzebyales bacterium]|jgi:peroxiredoxin Q/BCP|nr:thioredoxin-dependent thiol peroxidase [Euzebyales bacterium]